MVRKYLSILLLFFLAACSPKPRGPVEVLDKTYLDRDNGYEIQFSSKEQGKFKNYALDNSTTVRYTLEGDKLVITIPAEAADKKDAVLDLERSGDRFKGKAYGKFFEFSLKTPDDEMRIEKFKKEGREQAELNKSLSPQGAPSDKSVYMPTSSIDDENNDWMTWIAVSRNAGAQSEENLLGMLSKAWYGTNDSFKKQEVKASEIQRIKDKLDELKSVEYIALKKTDRNSGPTAMLDDKGYSFEKKGFPIFGSLCQRDLNVSTRSGASYSISGENDGKFCLLPVADESLARQIEEQRTKNSIRVDPLVSYFKIAGVSGDNRISLVPIGADFSVTKETYRQPVAGDELASFSVWPYK